MGSIAPQVLDQHIGTVWFERDTIYDLSAQVEMRKAVLHTVSIVDYRILDCDAVTSIRIPAIRVLCNVHTLASSCNVDIVEYNVARIGYKVIVLRRVPQHQVTHNRVL